jgi:hypothetical protein
MEELNSFCQDVSTRWTTTESRVLGHVILSPPSSVGVGSSNDGYTEDWAVIEIMPPRSTRAISTAMPLTLVPAFQLTSSLVDEPNSRNARSFTYPSDRLLRLKGTIPDEKVRHPTALHQNDDPCLMVTKRGNAAGLTVGRANDICSYTHNYSDDDNTKTSKE